MITVPGGPSLSNTKTTRAPSALRSKALAPRRPISSPAVNTTSTSAAGGSAARSRRSTRSTATAALSSAPRIVSPSLRTTPSSTDHNRSALGGHGVEMRRERDRRAPAAAGHADEEVAAGAAGDRGGTVFVDLQAEGAYEAR